MNETSETRHPVALMDAKAFLDEHLIPVLRRAPGKLELHAEVHRPGDGKGGIAEACAFLYVREGGWAQLATWLLFDDGWQIDYFRDVVVVELGIISAADPKAVPVPRRSALFGNDGLPSISKTGHACLRVRKAPLLIELADPGGALEAASHIKEAYKLFGQRLGLLEADGRPKVVEIVARLRPPFGGA